MTNEDYAKLSATLMPVARHLLEANGTFYPFAALLDQNHNAEHVAAGLESADSTAILAFLSRALKARMNSGHILAYGICVNVGARLPGYAEKVDAVCFQLEHLNAEPVQVFVPYRIIRAGEIEYEGPIALPGRAS